MALTRYYSWKDGHSKVALFVADDDSGYDSTFLKESSSVDSWQQELLTFDGYAAVVLDSLISTESERVPRPTVLSAHQWCLHHNLQACPLQRVVVVVSAGPGEATNPVHRWYWKGPDLEATLNVIKELMLRTASGKLAIEDWPVELSSQVDVLSDAIHDLQSLPILMDANTMNGILSSGWSPAELQKTCAEAWQANFAESEAGMGVIVLEAEVNRILSRKNKIGESVESIINTVPAKDVQELRDCRGRLDCQIQESKNALGLRDHRDRSRSEAAAWDSNSAVQYLEKQFVALGKEVTSLIEALRIVRESLRNR